MTLRSMIAVALAACSGSDAKVDAPATTSDGTFGPPLCDVSAGLTFTMIEYGFKPPGMGFDLDGDGDPDNALGFLAPIANQVINDAIDSGFSRYLFNVERWDNIPADDPEVGMVSYAGVDADRPPDTTNDFTGDGAFHITGRDFDVNCNPLNTSTSGRIVNRVLDLTADQWSLFVRNIGTVVFAEVRLQFRMSADLKTAEGDLGAVMTSCGLSRAYQPQLGGGTFLDLVLADGRAADIDVDGDGLETINYAAGQVTDCIDGDGTPIVGPQCVCDPRIADGYSLGVYARGVSCQIAGVVESD